MNRQPKHYGINYPKVQLFENSRHPTASSKIPTTNYDRKQDSKKAGLFVKFAVGTFLVAVTNMIFLYRIMPDSNEQKRHRTSLSVGVLVDLPERDVVALPYRSGNKMPILNSSLGVDHDTEFLYSYGNDYISLFRHNLLPSSMRDDILSSSKIRKVLVIVSHCDHDLSWMIDFFGTTIKPTIIIKVLIFAKCNRVIVGAPPDAEVFVLPNVGRCDHTYAHWLSNYAATMLSSSDDEDEIVLFTKDTGIFRGSRSRTFDDLLSLTILNGFSCMMLPSVTSYIHDYDLLKDFYWRHHEPHVRKSGNTKKNESISFKSEYGNLGEWVDKLTLVVNVTQNIVPVCYGGMFATSMVQIRKQPKWAWENLEESLSRGDNIEEGHFAERFWAALLSKPMSNEIASKIQKCNPSTYSIDTTLERYFTFAGMMLPPNCQHVALLIVIPRIFCNTR